MDNNENNIDIKAVDEEKGVRLKYQLYGFKNLILYDNHKYGINNKFIKSIEIREDNFESSMMMFVELQSNKSYYDNEQQIENFLDHICFNLIIKTQVQICQPLRILKSIEFGDSILQNDSIKSRDELKIVIRCPADEIYTNIVKSKTAMNQKFLKYQRIFSILHNPNMIVQFMSLYQFLMELLSVDKYKVEQKNVVNYFKKNKGKYTNIQFKPTRRKDCRFDEDIFTYTRNEIGHCEETNDLHLYEQLGHNINMTIIKDLVSVINDVLLDM